MEKEQFKVVHLRLAELDYELAIRGIKTTKNMTDKRKILSGLLSRDLKTPGSTLKLDSYSSTFDRERDEISTTLTSITTSIAEFDGNTSDSSFKVIKSRLCHVAGRIQRIVLPEGDADVERFKNESYATCFELEADLVEKASQNNDGNLDNTAVSEAPIINIPPPIVTCVTKQCPVSDWPIKFNGDSRKVFLFLETVGELAQSRKVSNDDLFSSAAELFTGDAFVWFRSIKNVVNNWDSLVSKLKEDFLSPCSDDDIWDEIKSRKQRKNETALIFIAQLENLFSRLSRHPAEETKIKTIRRNLLPEYISQLALVEIDSVSKISTLCKKLEEAKYFKTKNLSCAGISKLEINDQQDSSKGNFSRNNNSYQRQNVSQNFSKKSYRNRNFSKKSEDVSTSNNAADNSLPSTSENKKQSGNISNTIVCWNCQGLNHLYHHCRLKRKLFCYRCGRPEVKVSDCPVCSKN